MVGTRKVVTLYVLTQVGVVIGVDLLFIRHHVLSRLFVSIGMVLLFAAVSWRFLKPT